MVVIKISYRRKYGQGQLFCKGRSQPSTEKKKIMPIIINGYHRFLVKCNLNFHSIRRSNFFEPMKVKVTMYKAGIQ